MATALTLRISQIPANVPADQFIKLLETSFGEYPSTKGPGAARNIILWSFAPCATSVDRGRECVATVTFQEVPEALKRRGRVNIGKGEQLLGVFVDADFFGLTPLNNPAGDIEVDIVAVTGLAGHGFGSWKSRGAPEMWLRDFLPPVVGNARIMTYGYDSKLLKSSSTSSIHHFSGRFLETLRTARALDSERKRPLIFIGHSLGGLVIKQALVIAARGSERDKEILISSYGIFLFGVPNKGLDIEALRSMVEGQPNSRLIGDLSQGSETLRQLHQGFCEYFGFEDSPIVPIFETKKTKTVVLVDGKWKRDGPEVLMVTEDSATYSGPTTRRYNHMSIDADHSDVAKFEDRSNPEYIAIRDRLIGFVAEAPAAIMKRFETVGRSLDADDIIELRKRMEALLQPVNIKAHTSYISTKRCEGTGDWLLTDPHFLGWVRGMQSPQTLWLRGAPGIGKTFLMSKVLDYIKKHHWESTVAYFFCDNKNGNPDRRELPFIVKTLVFQLLSHILPYHPEDVGICLQQFEADAENNERIPWLFRKTMDRISKHFGRVFLVLDALDECGDVGGLVALLKSLEPTTFKIILSSRESTGLHLVSNSDNSISTITISPSRVKGDVETFIRNEVPLMDVRDLGGHREATTKLIESCGSLFLLADYRLKKLKQATFYTRVELDQALSELPKGLGDFYTKTLGEMKKRPNKERALLRRIFMWIIYAKRQLQFEELAEAVSIPLTDCGSSDSGAKLLLRGFEDICANLVILKPQDGSVPPRSLVELAHETVKDYVIELLWETTPPSEPLSDQNSCISEITQASITYISGLEIQQIDRYKVFGEEQLGRYHLLDYVFKFWILHLLDTNTPPKSLLDTLAAFLSSDSCYSWWCSPLSAEVNGTTDDGRRLQGRFKSWVANTASNDSRMRRSEPFMYTQQEKQVKHYTEKEGKDHVKTLSATRNLAKMYSDLGRWKEAGKMEEALLSTCKIALGEDHTITLSAASDLAYTYKRQGRWTEAIDVQKHVIEMSKTIWGEEHRDTLVAMRELARSQKFVVRWKEAEELQTYVLDTSRRVFGEKDLDTLIAMGDLGRTYKCQKRWEESEALHIQVMSDLKEILGEDDLHSLSATNDLAATYAFAGNLEDADRHQTFVVNTLKTVLFEGHEKTLFAMTDLAFIYLMQKRTDEAANLMEHVATTLRTSLGSTHPKACHAMGLLAICLVFKGSWLRAIGYNYWNNINMLRNFSPVDIAKEVISSMRWAEVQMGQFKLRVPDIRSIRYADLDGFTIFGEVPLEMVGVLGKNWGLDLGVTYNRDV